jgi:hypothetical protein
MHCYSIRRDSCHYVIAAAAALAGAIIHVDADCFDILN